MGGERTVRPLNIRTGVNEIYTKLPALNYHNEVIFSNAVPMKALNSIISKFKKNGIQIDMIKVGDRTALIKKGNINFNTYLLNNY